MATKLKEYFPMVREREEVLAEIAKSSALQTKFDGWEPDQQEEFLNICTGVKGLKLLYDGFFKEVMNPEYVPERFNDFLSSLLGQRGACYSADLLLRQYKRVRGEKQKRFSYRDIKNVYTIVLFEKNPGEFHNYPETCYHFFEQKSNTGLEIELLQKYLFIPLDIFKKSKHNRNISDGRDAWLTLFTSNEPEEIIEVIEKYPKFRVIYEECYEICLNMERVMEMFSKELYELDKNTVQYMIDEMQDTMDAQKDEIDAQRNEIDKQKETIDKQHQMIDEMQKQQKILYDQSISNMVSILRSLNIPDQEIIIRICSQYQIDEKQVRKYL